MPLIVSSLRSFYRKSRLLALCSIAIATVHAEGPDWPFIEPSPFVPGDQPPIFLASMGAASDLFAVMSQNSEIRIYDSTTAEFIALVQPALAADESWLWAAGLAACPDFESTQQLYTAAVARLKSGENRLRIYQLNLEPTPTGEAWAHSSQMLLDIPEQPPHGHGTLIAFATDGYLYIATQAAGNDAAAQDASSLLGKILRIDVRSEETPYGIPEANPFADDPDALSEIYAMGLRRPHSLHADVAEESIWLVDAYAAPDFVEVNRLPTNSTTAVNFGFPYWAGDYESEHFPPPPDVSATGPEFIVHDTFRVIGGVVGCSTNDERLEGTYLYGIEQKNILGMAKKKDGVWHLVEIPSPSPEGVYSSFHRSDNGTLFARTNGGVRRLVSSNLLHAPTASPQTWFADNAINLTLNSISPDVRIHYTLDGSDPGESSPWVEAGAELAIDGVPELRMLAYRDGFATSSIASMPFHFYVATLKIQVDGPILSGEAQIKFNTETDGVEYLLGWDGETAQHLVDASPIVTSKDNVLVTAAKNGYRNSTRWQFERIYQDAEVEWFAGGAAAGDVDGPVADARFNDPRAFCFTADGNMIVTDTGNHRIRMISPDGIVSTLAGSSAGFADGEGTAARFDLPVAVAVGPDGTIFVADHNNRRIRAISPEGLVSTIATTTREPHSVTVAPDGRMYWGQWAAIWSLDNHGAPVRIAGTGTANVNSLEGTFAIAHDGKRLLAMGSGIREIQDDDTIIKIIAERWTQNMVGSADGPWHNARVLATSNAALAVDQAGRWYLGQSTFIRKMRSDRWLITLAGGAGFGSPITGAGSEVSLGGARGLAVDSALRVYFRNGSTHAIYRITQEDADDDGIPDMIEHTEEGISPGVNDAMVDSFGTGQSNAMRWLAGLHPADSSTRFSSNLIFEPGAENATIRLEWPTSPRAVYRIEGSTDLQHWWKLGQLIPDAGQSKASMEFSLDEDAAYFRIRPIYREDHE